MNFNFRAATAFKVVKIMSSLRGTTQLFLTTHRVHLAKNIHRTEPTTSSRKREVATTDRGRFNNSSGFSHFPR
jgi:hypothetical protein